jgi:hypothetical protein
MIVPSCVIGEVDLPSPARAHPYLIGPGSSRRKERGGDSLPLSETDIVNKPSCIGRARRAQACLPHS